jgi:hypothetical protein
MAKRKKDCITDREVIEKMAAELRLSAGETAELMLRLGQTPQGTYACCRFCGRTYVGLERHLQLCHPTQIRREQ